jgi:hypothetical protein
MNGHAWPPLLPQPGANPDAVLSAIQRASLCQTGGAPLVPETLVPARVQEAFFNYKGYTSARDLYSGVGYAAVPPYSEELPNFVADIDTAPGPDDGIAHRARVVAYEAERRPSGEFLETNYFDDSPKRGGASRPSAGGRLSAARASRKEKMTEAPAPPLHERSEVIGVIVFFLWFAVGFFAYTMMPWGPGSHPFSTMEAIYFQVQILTTVGYGDIVPHHFAGKIFTSVYVLIAIVMITALVTQAVEKFMRETKGQVSLKMKKPGDEPPRMGEKYEKLLWHLAQFILVIAIGMAYILLNPDEFFKPETKVDIGKEPEQNEVADAFYLVIITMTTVGFGDIYPRSEQGRLVMTIWMVCAVISTANLIGSLTDTILKIKADMRLTELSEKLIEEIDVSGDGEVSKYEFLIFMLKKHDLVSDETVMEIEENFDALDKDGSGNLSTDDLKTMFC